MYIVSFFLPQTTIPYSYATIQCNLDRLLDLRRQLRGTWYTTFIPRLGDWEWDCMYAVQLLHAWLVKQTECTHKYIACLRSIIIQKKIMNHDDGHILLPGDDLSFAVLGQCNSHLPTESVSLEPLSVLCSAQFPTHGCMSCDSNWVIMWQSILTQVIRLSLAYPTTTSYDSSVNEAITCLPTFCVPNGELQQSLSVSSDQSASSVWDCKRDVILHLRGSHIVCY